MSKNDDAIIKRLNELYNYDDQNIKKLPLLIQVRKCVAIIRHSLYCEKEKEVMNVKPTSRT